jgi:anti-anti-sigma factor
MDQVEPDDNAPVSFNVAVDQAGALVVTLAGEMDMSTIDEVESQVTPALADRPGRLIVDVGQLRFADSSAIALWVRWASTVSDFELRNPSPLLRRVITAMGLAQKLAVGS